MHFYHLIQDIQVVFNFWHILILYLIIFNQNFGFLRLILRNKMSPFLIITYFYL